MLLNNYNYYCHNNCRFNGYDGRLDRELEAVVLVMEAFDGFEDKIIYDIIGHSGEEHKIVFVARDDPPKNNKERLEVIRVSTYSDFIQILYLQPCGKLYNK